MLKFLNFLKYKKIIIILLIVITIFSTLSYFYYKRIVLPEINKKYVENKEFISESQEEALPPTLYYFYTIWCPHCKSANSQWESLQSHTNSTINGKKIIFKSIDCDKDTATADKFKITGYPTIKLIYKNTIYNYDAKPDTETLLKFLNSVIN